MNSEKENKKNFFVRILCLRKGSITVFMTLIFLVILSLAAASVETLRFQTSRGYVRTAAENSSVTVFGNYNSELYSDYHLFAYGGFNGINDTDLSIELRDNIIKDLEPAPSGSVKKYSSVYQFKNIDAEVSEWVPVSECGNFFSQICRYSSGTGLKNTLNTFKETGNKISSGAEKKAGDITHAGEDALEDEKKRQENEDKENNEKSDDKNNSETPKENPLKTFNKMIKDGILGFICDPEGLSDEKFDIKRIEEVSGDADPNDIFERSENSPDIRESSEKYTDLSSSFISINNMLDSSDESNSMFSATRDKAAFIIWAGDMLTCYTDRDAADEEICSAEYVVSGKNNEKDCVISVMYRMLLQRMAVNLACIISDPDIRAKAGATALSLTSPMGLAFMEEAVKILILAIYSIDEAVVDTRALFEGREIPLIKNRSDLKLSYEDIFAFSKKKAEEKAGTYRRSDKSAITEGKVIYRDMLNILFMLMDNENICSRTCDMVELDLREKYNSSFLIDETISSFKAEITYTVPYIYTGSAGRGAQGFAERGGIGTENRFTVSRSYG